MICPSKWPICLSQNPPAKTWKQPLPLVGCKRSDVQDWRQCSGFGVSVVYHLPLVKRYSYDVAIFPMPIFNCSRKSGLWKPPPTKLLQDFKFYACSLSKKQYFNYDEFKTTYLWLRRCHGKNDHPKNCGTSAKNQLPKKTLQQSTIHFSCTNHKPSPYLLCENKECDLSIDPRGFDLSIVPIGLEYLSLGSFGKVNLAGHCAQDVWMTGYGGGLD